MISAEFAKETATEKLFQYVQLRASPHTFLGKNELFLNNIIIFSNFVNEYELKTFSSKIFRAKPADFIGESQNALSSKLKKIRISNKTTNIGFL